MQLMLITFFNIVYVRYVKLANLVLKAKLAKCFKNLLDTVITFDIFIKYSLKYF